MSSTISDTLQNITMSIPTSWTSQAVNNANNQMEKAWADLNSQFNQINAIKENTIIKAKEVLWEPKVNYDRWWTINGSNPKWQILKISV